MRTALALTMIVAGVLALRSAFAENPDPRLMLAGLFGGATSGGRMTGGGVRTHPSKQPRTAPKQARDDGRMIP